MFDPGKLFVNGLHRCNVLAGRLFRRKFPAYRFSRGKIRPAYSCSINAVDHCNLSCRDCNHASPVLPKFFADPQVVYRDLSFLAPYYKPGIMSIQGGEPLLHPALPEIIEAIRASGICQYVSVTTNGTLLDAMPDPLWDAINRIDLSIYPSTGFDGPRLDRLQQKAKRHRTRLLPTFVGEFSFRATFSLPGTKDDSLVRRIYRNCKIANCWGCHTVHQGYFYKCPQCIYIPDIPGCRADFPPAASGFRLQGEKNFSEKLWSYLSTENPLPACRFCLGTVGKTRPQKQVPNGAWTRDTNAPTEELIDMKILQAAERGEDLDLEKHTFLKS